MSRKKLIDIVKKRDRSIKEIYEEYLKHCISIGQSEGTIESKKLFFRYSLPKIVKVDDKISTFTKDKLDNHIIWMRKSGYSGNYYQTLIIKSKAFLTYCFNHHYLKKFEIKIPIITQKKKEIYHEDELIKLLKKPNLRTCLVGEYKSWVTINFCLGTGCRAATLLNVLVKDVNFQEKSILFRHMKAHKQITVPLSPTLENVLMEYIELLDLKDDDLLFPKLDKKKMSYDTLHQEIDNYCKHRYIKMRGINVYRNTFATLFIKNGNKNIYLLQKLLGHADIKQTERYINLLPLEMKEDINKYNPLDVLSHKRLKLNRVNKGGRGQ
jgi:integrase/recombinase XerD